jgi:hypothetical protein
VIDSRASFPLKRCSWTEYRSGFEGIWTPIVPFLGSWKIADSHDARNFVRLSPVFAHLFPFFMRLMVFCA